MSPLCKICRDYRGSLRGLKRHYRSEHAGDSAVPEEYRGGPDAEQRDFDGNEPDDSDYNPEYETTNDPPETEKAVLDEFTGDDDG